MTLTSDTAARLSLLADKVLAAPDHGAVPTPPRLRFSGYISAVTLRRARGLVAALQGTARQVSLNDLIEAGLRHECARLERLTNDGRQYPPADEVGGPRGGRRS